MKIKYILLILTLFWVTASFAQVAVRADVGIAGYNTTCFEPVQITSTPGFASQLGIDYDFRIKKSFHLTSGLYWSYRAVVNDSTIDDVIGFVSLMEHFLNVPLHAKWKFNINPEKFGIYVYAGPTFSCGMSSRSYIELMVSDRQLVPVVRVEGTYDHFSGKFDFIVPGRPEISDYLFGTHQDDFEALGLKGGYSRFEARLDCGVGFIIKEHHEIVTGYDFGLNNRVKGSLAENNFMNVGTLYVGYRYRFAIKDK